METPKPYFKVSKNNSSDSDSDSSPASKRCFAEAVIEFPITASNLQTNEKQRTIQQKSDLEVPPIIVTPGQQEFLARKLSDFLDQQLEFVSTDLPIFSPIPDSEVEHKLSIRLFSHSARSSLLPKHSHDLSSSTTCSPTVGLPPPLRKRHKHKEFSALVVSGEQVLAQSHLPHFTNDQKSNADENQALSKLNIKSQ